MTLVGAELLARLARHEVASLKMVFNATGALIFPMSAQHRDNKLPGISYEDDYHGNALAAMIRPGEIEIRFHREFRDADVASILKCLLVRPEMQSLAGARATYQGRPIAF